MNINGKSNVMINKHALCDIISVLTGILINMTYNSPIVENYSRGRY